MSTRHPSDTGRSSPTAASHTPTTSSPSRRAPQPPTTPLHPSATSSPSSSPSGLPPSTPDRHPRQRRRRSPLPGDSDRWLSEDEGRRVVRLRTRTGTSRGGTPQRDVVRGDTGDAGDAGPSTLAHREELSRLTIGSSFPTPNPTYTDADDPASSSGVAQDHDVHGHTSHAQRHHPAGHESDAMGTRARRAGVGVGRARSLTPSGASSAPITGRSSPRSRNFNVLLHHHHHPPPPSGTHDRPPEYAALALGGVGATPALPSAGVAAGLGGGGGGQATQEQPVVPADLAGGLGSVPDYATGRGGDGIGGANVPTPAVSAAVPAGSAGPARENVLLHPTLGDAAMAAAAGEGEWDDPAARQELVRTLRGVLSCSLCPQAPDGTQPPLHHPLTLPCGHTLSSPHLHLPPPPPFPPAHPADATEQWAAQQRRQQHRLAAWAGAACLVPGCKRYAGPAGLDQAQLQAQAQAPAPAQGQEQVEQVDQAATTGGGRALPSGVAYYPPPGGVPSSHPPVSAPVQAQPAQPAQPQGLALTLGPRDSLPPAYSFSPPPPPSHHHTQPAEANLLDTRVDKLIELVQQEHFRQASSADEHARGHEQSGRPRTGLKAWSDSSNSSVTSSDEDGAGDGDLDDVREARAQKRRRHRHVAREPVAGSRMGELPFGGAMSGAGAGGQGEEWQFRKELMANLECDVCALMLYEPVTTPCQHSFCAKCLSRSLDHSTRCPVCRQDLPSFSFFQDHPANKLLVTILTTAFPAEYAERQASLAADERTALLSTPIFVCTLAFPGMPTILHVFEPRYRLMIRRCIESASPRFGMVLPARGAAPEHLQGVMEYGTMLEIQSVQMLPDGRSMVETVGTHRFRLLDKGSMDGYTVGRIERMDDISPEDEADMERTAIQRRKAMTSTSASAPMSTTASFSGTAHPGHPGQHTPHIPTAPMDPSAIQMGGPPPGGSFGSMAHVHQGSSGAGPSNVPSPDDTPESTEELMAICRAFIDQLRSGSAPWLLQRLNNTYGSMPDDPSEFSYWMALVMPIDEYEKARLLPIRSPRLRLKLIVHWVESLRSSWWFSQGCVVG
ncbi:hypothetical protein IAT38_005256 [Cryptococcus sp. DSM 104549]